MNISGLAFFIICYTFSRLQLALGVHGENCGGLSSTREVHEVEVRPTIVDEARPIAAVEAAVITPHTNKTMTAVLPIMSSGGVVFFVHVPKVR